LGRKSCWGREQKVVVWGRAEANFTEEGLGEENRSSAAVVYIRIGNVRTQGCNAWEKARTCRISFK